MFFNIKHVFSIIKYGQFLQGVGLESTKWKEQIRDNLFNCWAAIHVHAEVIVGLWTRIKFDICLSWIFVEMFLLYICT